MSQPEEKMLGKRVVFIAADSRNPSRVEGEGLCVAETEECIEVEVPVLWWKTREWWRKSGSHGHVSVVEELPKE